MKNMNVFTRSINWKRNFSYFPTHKDDDLKQFLIKESPNMTQTLAFDVYGTLINISGVFDSLYDMIPEQADSFMATWRQKQLEYSFRRGLMDRHTDFSVCTRDALSYCCSLYSVDLKSNQRSNF